MTPTGDRAARRRRAAVAGHDGDVATARALAADPDADVRSTALGALARLGALTAPDLVAAAEDPAGAVRRRVAEVLADPAVGTDAPLAALLGDTDPWVVEVAAWAAGERHGADPATGVAASPAPAATADRLAALAAGHDEPLVREAAVAALGAIGDPAALDVVLAATGDRPAVRRRAVVALAAFLDDARAVAALQRAGQDRDWQVREAAEILLDGLDDGGAGDEAADRAGPTPP